MQYIYHIEKEFIYKNIFILVFIYMTFSYINVRSPGQFFPLKVKSKLYIDQGQTTLHILFWCIS